MNSIEIYNKFMSMKEEELTQEACNSYFKLVERLYSQIGEIVRNDSSNRDKLIDSFSKIILGIYRIPEKMRTTYMCNNYFQINKNRSDVFDFIPESKRTPYMYWEYFQLHKQDEMVFLRIPEKERNNAMYKEFFDAHIDKFYVFSMIPKVFRCKEMYLDFFYKHLSRFLVLEKIPNEYLTKDMYLEFFNKHKNNVLVLEKIPEEYITDEMFSLYLDSNLDKLKCVKAVPKKFLTKSFYEKYFKVQNQYMRRMYFINDIPEEFLTDEMILSFFIKRIMIVNIFDFIPKGRITPKMVDEYFKCHRNSHTSYLDVLMNLPNYLITINIAYEYYKKTNDIIRIPDSLKTKEMCLDYFDRKKSIIGIPEEYLTKEMVLEYFNINKNNVNTLNNIPSRMITKEMVLEFLSIHEDRDNIVDFIPREVITEDVLKNININNCTLDSKKKIIYNELTWIVDNGKTLKEIMNKYGVSTSLVSNILEMIKEDNIDLYQQIKKVLDNNSNSYIQVIYRSADKITQLIEFIDYKRNSQLTQEQKIKFSYLLPKLNIKTSIASIYRFISTREESSKKYNLFVNFCKFGLYYKYTEMKKDSDVLMYQSEKEKARTGDNWLHLFKLDDTFDNRKITVGYINKDGETEIINKDKAKKIVSLLKKNGIRPTNCIVREAFRRYVRNELSDFIIELLEEEGKFVSCISTNKKLVKE